MARIGVTYIDISKAAETIKSLGQEPTVDRVREQLGTGSKSTIAPLLKRWRADTSDNDNNNGLPNDLIEVVKSLHERVQQMAARKIESAQTEFNTVTEELRDELATERNTIARLRADQQKLERHLKLSQEQNKTLSKSLDESLIKTSKSEFQRDEALVRVSELKSTITELKQENRDIRDHFEHYQQRTADDRQLERDQFTSTKLMLQEQVGSLNNQLTKTDNQLSVEIKERVQQQTINNDLGIENQNLKQNLDSKVIEVVTLSDKLKSVVDENLKLHTQNNDIQQRLNSMVGLHSVADKEIEMIKFTLDKTVSELREAKDKIKIITDENKVVLQEKAILQGQFKQLQSSL